MPSRPLLVAAMLLGAAPAVAGPPRPEPLAPLPATTLDRLAPLARTADLALIESRADGKVKQMTTLAFAAAPPATVRQALLQLERYPEFVRNLKQSQVTPQSDGSTIHAYRISYGIYTVFGRLQYLPQPPTTPGIPGAVEVIEPEPDSPRHFRWEFRPALGGTLIVLYGYTPIPDDGFMNRFLRTAPTLEHGLALLAQLTLLKAIQRRAEQLAPGTAVTSAAPPTGGLDPLLQRGVVAILRSRGDHLADLSLVARSRASTAALLTLAAQPASWAGAWPTVTRAADLGPQEGLATVEIEQSLPLLSWTSVWGIRRDATAVDLFALSGDLRGDRLRWDVRPVDGGSEVVLRSQVHYEAGSLVVRQLYRLEPFFEYGVNVGLNLVLLEALRQHAAPGRGG